MARARADADEWRGGAGDVRRRTRHLAAGGLLGAIFAASCCIVPLVLVVLGISGAWIGSLTALEPYKAYFIVAALVILGLGFYQAYFRPKPTCEADTYCARLHASLVTQIALWLGAMLVALAATVGWWAPMFY